MSKQQQEKRWWVSRAKSGVDYCHIHHTRKRPDVHTELAFLGVSGAVQSMRYKDFRQVYVLRLRKGECKEIERPTLILKQKR